MSVTEVNREIELVHPKMRSALTGLLENLKLAYQSGETESLFQIYEGFRLPQRQAYLLQSGATKAGPWQSAHQFGLAADLVPTESRRGGIVQRHGWSWNNLHDWEFLKRTAQRYDLAVPIAWDRCHVEHPAFPRVRRAMP